MLLMRTCTQCGETKESSAFSFRDKSAGRRHEKCKVCVAANGRQHYASHRLAYIARNVRTMRTRRRSLKARVWQHLVEHPCVDCGERDLVVLDFDHIDPATKRGTIYRLAQQAFSWATIQAEIAQCQVRCANCPHRRTARQFGWAKLVFAASAAVDQSSAAGRPPRPRARLVAPNRSRPATVAPLTQAMITAGLRSCSWCGRALPAALFSGRERTHALPRPMCVECFRAYRREHYRQNRQAYVERNVALFRARRLEWQRRLCAYLRDHPCADCGEADPIVLEFDHRDPATKTHTLNWLVRRGHAWPTVLEELAKCDVRCANCHRRRTAVQFNWPNLQVSTAPGALAPARSG